MENVLIAVECSSDFDMESKVLSLFGTLPIREWMVYREGVTKRIEIRTTLMRGSKEEYSLTGRISDLEGVISYGVKTEY